MSMTLNVPGPGNYQSSLVDKTAAPKFGFGSEKRDGMASKHNFPGPGQYVAPNLTGKEGKSSSIHAKI